jgi:hypothetical protein
VEGVTVKENEVGALVEDWLDQIGATRLSYWDAKVLDYNARMYPDLIAKPKFSRRILKNLVAIEVKGSKFNMRSLLGQLLLYSLCFSRVYVAIPSEREPLLRKLRSEIKGKIKGFDFGIISVTKNGKVRVLPLEKEKHSRYARVF